MSLMAFPSAPSDGDVSGKWVYNAASGAWVLNEGAITLANSTTDDLAEGVGNIYYTDARVDARVTGSLMLDEDGMTSNSATKVPTQQSVKSYVDTVTGQIGVSNFLGTAIVTEGEGVNSSDNDTSLPTTAAVKDYIDGKTTKAAIDALGIVATSTSGNAATVTNGVYTTGNQTIAGTKTFSSTISGSINGNAATATTATDCSRQVIAGTGLTGGGAMTANRTLNVIGGTGITANANDIRVNADQRGNVTLIGANTNDYIQTGTTNHSFILDGNVDVRIFNTGELHADGDVVAFSTSISDQRFKDQVTPVTNATETCKKLQGVEYTWNATGRKGKRDLGFIAQEIEKVIPNIVHTKTLSVGEWADNPMDAKTVDYEKLTAVLVEAVKELSARIDHLESN